MNVRSLVIITLFVAGTTGAVILVAGAASSNPILVIDDPEPASVGPDPEVPAVSFAHAIRFLSSIPDAKNLLTSGRGASLPHAPGTALRHFRRERIVPGAIELLRHDQTVGLFQASVEIIPIDATHFVLHRAWHGPDVVLICVAIPDLKPLSETNLIERAETISDGDEFFILDESAYAEVQISRGLTPGEHSFSFPEGSRDIDEILLLYPSTRDEATNRTHVMRVEPRKGRVTIVAPREGAFRQFDEAQAPVRLLRDPKTGRPVGDGTRVRAFVLSEDLTHVETWLN